MLLKKSFSFFHGKILTNFWSCKIRICVKHNVMASQYKYSPSYTLSSQNSVNMTQDSNYLIRNNFSNLKGSDSESISVENLSRQISKGDRFIKMIKLEPVLDKRGLTNILGNFRYVKKVIIGSMNAKEEIKSSEEFSRLLKALEENASNLGTEELINCLSLFHWFELPKEDFFVVLMTTLIERVSDLELEKAVFLLELVKTVDKDDTDDLRNELIEELKFKIENEILEQEQTGDGLSDLDAGLAIRYTQIEDCSNWPDELLTKLIVKVLGSKNPKSYLRNLEGCQTAIQYMKNDNEKDLAREKLFKRIYDIMLEKCTEQSYAGIELSQFLANYAYHILTNKEIFDERFFNDVLDHCMLGKKSLKQLRYLCKSVRTISYPKVSVVREILRIFRHMPEPSVFPRMRNYWVFLDDCLNILSWTYQWKEIPNIERFEMHSIIRNLPILNNISLWENAALIECLAISVYLLSMGIYSDELINFLRKKIKHLDLENENSHVCYNLLTLHQALATSNKTYPEPLLTEEMLSIATRKVYKPEDEMSKDYRNLREDIIKTMELILPEKSCLLIDKFTKLGHTTGCTLALTGVKNKEFYDFKSVSEKYIEDISLPENSQLVLLMPMVSKHYSMKPYLIKPHGRIKINSLEAMGYKTVPSFEVIWFRMSEEEKKNYLLENIFGKRKRLKSIL